MTKAISPSVPETQANGDNRQASSLDRPNTSGDALLNKSQQAGVRVPLLTTSFARNTFYYALLWPIWWILGIEQLLLPVFLGYEFVRLLWRANWQVRLNSTSTLAVLLGLWWFVPIIWLDRDFLDIFLKETATIWSQALILILFWNCVRSEEDWRNAIRSLVVMAGYAALAGITYLVGIWRGSLTSGIGHLLPQSLVENSAFFSSIAIRQFGSVADQVGLLPFRLQSISLSFSSLSMICLLLIPLMVWKIQTARGSSRFLYIAITVVLGLCLILTESRISYVAFLVGLVAYIILRLGLLRGKNLPFTVSLFLMLTALALLVGYVGANVFLRSIEAAFIDLRPSSWLTRLNIYVVTLRLLGEHPIAGWGVPVRIPGAASTYSAGTHSSYLGMLFQHGIIGLLLYLGIWLTVWKQVIRGLRDRTQSRELALFWVAIAVAFFAFNLREIADSWWWDQSLTFTIWMLWGLAITAPTALAKTSQIATWPNENQTATLNAHSRDQDDQ